MNSLVSFPDVQNLLDIGYAPIPLRPGTKKALCDGWPQRDPLEMWEQAPGPSNVGIRCGDGIAVIDCDDKARPGTFATMQRILAGLGCDPDGDYPLVQTASGCGRHIYVRLLDAPSGSVKLLQSDVGTGELRYGSGAYVVAPPSIVHQSPYALLEGDWRQLPRLEWRDLTPYIGAQAERLSQEPQPKRIPRNTLRLLQGISDRQYPSRSEYEQAILTGLANVGFEFAEVQNIFLYFRPPRFAELYDRDSESALRYLQDSFENARAFVSNNESDERRQANAWARWGKARAWPGRGGASDRAIFLAHVQCAWQAGHLVYGASARDLAELAGVSAMTASEATRRLISKGYLAKTNEATPEKAACYRLPSAPPTATLDATSYTLTLPPLDATSHTLTLPLHTPVRECKGMQHDAFRHAGLGKSASEVWESLTEAPTTITELAERTGRNRVTVSRVLHRMERLLNETTGEIVRMVRQEDEVWHALDVDLNQVAELIGTAGAGERQRQQHAEERQKHKRDLQKIRSRKRPATPDGIHKMPSARQKTILH